MKPAVHEYSLLIIERHLDTFGHVNNATYLEIFEQARWEWISSHGYGLALVQELQQGPTVLECTVRFRRELRNRQRVNVCSHVSSYVGKIARIQQEIRLPDGQVACEAEFVVGLFDLVRRKLIEPTPQWLASVGLSQQDWQPSSNERGAGAP
jgi:YbgC/YbaW family acyl-CoA thioester hydrolase